MATIRDIAKLTGVSVSTVSNVLSGKTGSAGAETAERVREAARILQYRPNTLARGLKQQRANRIGILVEDLTAPGTPEIVDGIEARCERAGYGVTLRNLRCLKRPRFCPEDSAPQRERLDALLADMRAEQAEALLYVGCRCREISYWPRPLAVPAVFVHCYPAAERYPSVLSDDEGAAYSAVQQLMNAGRRRIGVLAGHMSDTHLPARLRGYQRALLHNGQPFVAARVLYSAGRYAEELQNATRLLDSPPDDEPAAASGARALGVDALLCFQDSGLSAAYDLCLTRALAVPEDVALFGFGTGSLPRHFAARPGFARLPLRAMGERAVDILLPRLQGKSRHALSGKPERLPCILQDVR